MEQRIVSVTAIVLGAFLWTACSSLNGGIRDGRYISPAGNFTVPLPDSLGHIYVTDGYDKDGGYGFIEVVTDMGDLERISYDHEGEEFHRKIRAIQGSGHFRDFMRGYFEEVFLPKNYPPSSGASVMSRPVFLPSQHGEMLFAVVRLPEGSGARDMKTGKVFDGIRGVLIFFRGGYSYHLHTEATGMFQLRPSTEDAKLAVLSLLEKIDFHS